MSSTTLLTIIGAIATIFLGSISIYLAIKKKYQGKITFIKVISLDLFDSIVKNLPELSVLYKGKPISENIVLLKGYLLNTGSKDISETMIEERIKIELPDKFKWLTVKIISKYPKVTEEFNDNRNILIFNSGLFRREEFIHFEALIEVQSNNELQNIDDFSVSELLEKNLKFTHRIADTKKIEIRKYIPKTPLFTKEIVAAIIGLIGCFLLLHFVGLPPEINYLMQSDEGQQIQVRIQVTRENELKIFDINSEYKTIMTLEDFFNQESLKPIYSKSNYNMILLILACPLVFFFLIQYFLNRQKKKQNIMLNEK